MAGPNGAGKTTAAYTLLPEILNVWEFVNADEIARGLSPFNVESVAFEAGRLMLQRIDYLLEKGISFTIETTLSTRSYVQLIRRAQQMGYVVGLYYFWIPSAAMSKERVALRVLKGGHNIPPNVIERRYGRSVENLVKRYISVCDYFTIFNNATSVTVEVASGGMYLETDVLNREIWETIQNYEDNNRS